jgi:hypothetical protein
MAPTAEEEDADLIDIMGLEDMSPSVGATTPALHTIPPLSATLPLNITPPRKSVQSLDTTPESVTVATFDAVPAHWEQHKPGVKMIGEVSNVHDSDSEMGAVMSVITKADLVMTKGSDTEDGNDDFDMGIDDDGSEHREEEVDRAAFASTLISHLTTLLSTTTTTTTAAISTSTATAAGTAAMLNKNLDIEIDVDDIELSDEEEDINLSTREAIALKARRDAVTTAPKVASARKPRSVAAKRKPSSRGKGKPTPSVRSSVGSQESPLLTASSSSPLPSHLLGGPGQSPYYGISTPASQSVLFAPNVSSSTAHSTPPPSFFNAVPVPPLSPATIASIVGAAAKAGAAAAAATSAAAAAIDAATLGWIPLPEAMEAVADAKAQQSQLANPPQSNFASTLPLSISAGYTYEGGSQFTVEEEMGPEQLAQLAQLGIGPGMGSQLAVDMDSHLSEFADLSQLGIQLQQPQIDQLSQIATGMPGGLDLEGSMYPQDAFAAS